MHKTLAGVELHTVDLRAEGHPWESWVADLAPAERARADRFAFPEGRRRFVVGRVTLRRLLGSRLGVPAAEVQLIDGAHGKPALAPCHDAIANGLSFNLTHSGELALVALGQGDLGVDLESPLRVVDAMAVVRRFFSEAERNGFESLPAGADRDRLFFRVWTRKEALVKAVGRGLSCPLSSFTVPIGDLPPEGVRIDCPEQSGRRWRLFEIGSILQLGTDWVASLVVVENRR
jgi:4'-phosphopantetheinyl transferase